MKTKYIILLLCCCSFFSCNDFLREEPLSEFETKSFYKDRESVLAGVYGIYQGYRTLPQFLATLGTCGTDIAKPYKSTTEYGKYCTYSFTSEQTFFDSLWSGLYTIIMRANSIIAIARDNDFLSESENRRFEAEALFLRAYAYYILVCYWGDVPLITQDIKDFDYTLPREPLHKVYKQIVSDLKTAASPGYLPEKKPTDTPARVCRYAPVAMLGKVYLTMASYKESAVISGYELIEEDVNTLYSLARTELKDVMEHGNLELMKPYGSLFGNSYKTSNTETLFEIFFGPGELGSGWSREVFGGYGNGNGIDLRLYGAYCGKRNILPVGTFISKYKKGDMRYNWNIQDSSIVFKDGIWSRTLITDREKMFIPKYRQGNWNELLSHGYGQSENNYPLLRFGDVLLMFAETEIKLNNGKATIDAVNAVNRLIVRARYPKKAEDTPAFKDYTESTLTFSELMNERARELCYEDSRKIDLLRTGKLEEMLGRSSYTGHKANLKKTHYLFPIPAYEIRLTRNPEGFRQNPGYGEGAEK